MISKKTKKSAAKKPESLSEQLHNLHYALGRTVIVLELTEKAIKKDKDTLRVNALQLRDQIRGLQKRQREIFANLEKAGVLK